MFRTSFSQLFAAVLLITASISFLSCKKKSVTAATITYRGKTYNCKTSYIKSPTDNGYFVRMESKDNSADRLHIENIPISSSGSTTLKVGPDLTYLLGTLGGDRVITIYPSTGGTIIKSGERSFTLSGTVKIDGTNTTYPIKAEGNY